MRQEDIKETILESSSRYVTGLFNEQQPVWAVYHDLLHTIETFNGCLEIGGGSGISEEDLEIICISAWFHDTGYLFTVEEHEERSSEIALNFLEKNGYPGHKINKVIN
jgi:HD superfamily phosphodiesterase